MIAKEIDYRGAFRFDTEFDASIALLAQTDILDPVITHTFDLAEAEKAMETAADPQFRARWCCALRRKTPARSDRGARQPLTTHPDPVEHGERSSE